MGLVVVTTAICSNAMDYAMKHLGSRVRDVEKDLRKKLLGLDFSRSGFRCLMALRCFVHVPPSSLMYADPPLPTDHDAQPLPISAIRFADV